MCFYCGINPEVLVALLPLSSLVPVRVEMARPALFTVAAVLAASFLSGPTCVGCSSGRRVSAARLPLLCTAACTANATVSCRISISCYRPRTELGCLVAFQVGDAMDSDVSGVSVPLEHSFEVGERVSRFFSSRVSANSLLLTLAPWL